MSLFLNSKGWKGNSTEPGYSIGDGVVVNRIVLKEGHNVIRLRTVVYMTDSEFAFFSSNSIFCVESCKIDQSRSNNQIM